MKTLKTVPGQNLVLGHRGENLATRIIFSIAPWVETYGPGTAHLLHQRQGDSEPYPVATLQEGTEVSWDVTDGDTALEGYGKYELRYYVAETLVKSSVGETYTMKALQYGAEPPDPIQGWVDHVLEKENEIYEAASETKGYSEAAERAAGDALNFANAADQSAGNARLSAKTAADQAGQAAGSAKEAKEAAEEARKIVDGADVVKSVNGQAPDKNGNVQIEVGTGSGVDVTAKPGQLIRVKEVDEEGKPTEWEAVDPVAQSDWNAAEGEPGHVLNRTHWSRTKELLPLTKVVGENGELTIAPVIEGVAVGGTYIVNYNGADYECVCADASVIAPGAFALGDIDALTGSPSGAYPFVVGIVSPDTAAQMGVGGMVFDFSGASSAMVSISDEDVYKLDTKFLPDGVPFCSGDGTKIRKIDPRCMPDNTVDVFQVRFNTQFADNAWKLTTTTTFEEIYEKVKNEKVIAIAVANFSGTEIISQLSNITENAVGFSHVDMNTDSVSISYISVRRTGEIVYRQTNL